jgi:hypothetical protein
MVNHKVDDDISDLEYSDWMDSQFYNLDYELNRSNFIHTFHNGSFTNIPIKLFESLRSSYICIYTGENC